MNRVEMIESSGNVFADLGLEDPEILLGKAEMVRLIASTSESRGYEDADLARVLDADLETVVDLLRGRLGRFPIERLISYLNALDFDVEISIRRSGAENLSSFRVSTA
jgi:predicted XRE-type DNA-binding protein